MNSPLAVAGVVCVAAVLIIGGVFVAELISAALTAEKLAAVMDDGPHLDPNGCVCDECRAALAIIREVVAADHREAVLAAADFSLWEIECAGFVRGVE